jgi:hypothetical protein
MGSPLSKSARSSSAFSMVRIALAADRRQRFIGQRIRQGRAELTPPGFILAGDLSVWGFWEKRVPTFA